jgi:uncharacterized protein (DUF697 family)/predicted GTPase
LKTAGFLAVKRLPFNLPNLKFPDVQGILAKLSGWFTVDEAEIAAILAEVRSGLPTTEVWLVGKPQTGKSSIIRALTGVGSEIIGQGFRPHTAHTQRYSYPSADVPLLIFTDTVGLGESQTETQAVIQELQQQLSLSSPMNSPEQPPTPKPAAKILILTIRVGDFATDSLKQIVRALRQQSSQVPCLLAITCLHQVYPGATANHPTYPPNFPDLQRVVRAIQTQFKGLVDRTVLIDFTLEDDGFDPVFYGLDQFVEQLSELLPEAEARLLNQLLEANPLTQELGNLYREAGRRYILPFALAAGTLAAVPIPFATMPVLTTLQTTMVGLLARLYGQNLTPAQAGGLVSTIAGGFLAQVIGQQLVKFIPGWGSVVAASWAAAYTWALGEAACIYFGDLLGGNKPDPERLKQIMRESFSTAQARFKQSAWPSGNGNTPP